MTDIRRGRRWAHGRRFVRGDRGDLGLVLTRLGERSEAARELLRRAVRATGERGVRVRPEEATPAEALAAAGVIRLEEKVEGTAAEARWVPWRATVPEDVESEVAEVLGLVDPDAERAALLADVAGVEPLAAELELLREVRAGSGLAPPEGSVLTDRAWTTYQAAMRAAAVWYRTPERLSPRELAARALGWSKAWTPARREAFETLLDRPFDEAVSVRERFLRVRGPVAWRFEDREADARAARPWLGLPVSSVPAVEVVSCSAEGVLVVENLETFEEVARRSDAPDTWVCVYGGGYVEEAVVQLLDRLSRPVAAWADIDPDGIAIVEDLAARLGRRIAPVGMDPAWLETPAARVATQEQLAHARRIEERTDEAALRDIALAIVDQGRVLEQESIQTAVIHELSTSLRRL